MINFFKKVFYQPRRAFPTTDPIAYHLKMSLFAKLMGLKPLSSLMYVIPSWRKRWSDLDINERIVEVPFVFKNLPQVNKAKILDVGCCETIMPIQLSSLGYKVTGIDIRPYDLSHPNFSFVQEDICETKLLPNQFDLIICISAIEHIGLDTIYGRSNKKSSDKKAIKSMFSLLKPGGKILLTMPAGVEFSQSEFMKIYSPKKIHQLLKDFKVIKEIYYAPNSSRTSWRSQPAEQLPSSPNFGVVTIIAQKPAHPRK